MPEETKDELVQVVLKMPRADLEAVKKDVFVDMNATAVVAFVHKTLRERGLVED
jgi:hypothetical protein